MDTKLIFTVESPEDLYIIGDFIYDDEIKKLINEKVGSRRFVGITDDYHSIGVMGDAKKKPANYCETGGSFLLLTESEWKDIQEMIYNHADFSFGDLPDEPYAICIHDYVGPVKVDLIDEDGESALPEYDDSEYLTHQDSKTSDDYCEPIVLLKSGFKTTCKFIQELHGFIRDTSVKWDDIYINFNTNEEYIGNYSSLPDGDWTEIGTRKISISKWLKK